uniref:Uncharacterized protein n=1 Tax=Anopheles minimus TaxID=112268 RepID=A0A182WN50_9DIPT
MKSLTIFGILIAILALGVEFGQLNPVPHFGFGVGVIGPYGGYGGFSRYGFGGVGYGYGGYGYGGYGRGYGYYPRRRRFFPAPPAVLIG